MPNSQLNWRTTLTTRSLLVFGLLILATCSVSAQNGNGLGNTWINSTPAVIGGTIEINWGAPNAPFGQSLLLMSDGLGPVTHSILGLTFLNLNSPSFGLIFNGLLNANSEGSLIAGIPALPSLVNLAPFYIMAIGVDFSIPSPFLSVSRTARIDFENPDGYRPIAAMAAGRALHTATGLHNGQYSNQDGVFISGGGNGTLLSPVSTDSTEVYDPRTHSFSAGPVMAYSRAMHQSVLLDNGKVLILGGSDTNGIVAIGNEIYDPVTNTLSPAAAMLQGRSGHIATKLANGKVLVTGGVPSFTGGTTNLPAVLNGAMNTAEVYDPATDSWTAVSGTMGDRRMGHAQIMYAGGTKVLVCGGINGGTTFFGQGVPTWSATADIYDVATNSISPTASFSSGRAGHSLTLLSNGDVLLAGGVVSGLFMIPTATNNCQTWSPASGTWSSTGSLVDSRGMHTAAVLENGNTIVVGGLTGTFLAIAATSTVEEHTGVSASPRAAIGTNPGIAGATSVMIGSHQMTRLANGTFLVSGGSDGASASSNAYVFKP
jgi:hypothetical protein